MIADLVCSENIPNVDPYLSRLGAPVPAGLFLLDRGSDVARRLELS
jgi:hypothetical protein